MLAWVTGGLAGICSYRLGQARKQDEDASMPKIIRRTKETPLGRFYRKHNLRPVDLTAPGVKPRIYKASGGGWWCKVSGAGLVGYAETPRAAYADWLWINGL